MTVATALMVQAQLPQLDPKIHQAWRNYAVCIQDKMIELAPSNAPVDEIFDAAKTECSASWVQAYDLFRTDFDKKAPAPSGKSSQQMSIDMLDQAAAGAKDRAGVAILRRRAGLPPIDVNTL